MLGSYSKSKIAGSKMDTLNIEFLEKLFQIMAMKQTEEVRYVKLHTGMIFR